LFEEGWAEALADRQERSPSFYKSEYIATGRATAEYGGKRTEQWWLDHGPAMVQAWIDWREREGWAIWETPTGLPAIELELNVVLPGDIPVKMFIDRVMVTKAGQLVVVDLKTGARMPETPDQLGLYAVGIELTFGAAYRPAWGYFWHPEKAHGQPLGLDRYTAHYFSNLYNEAIKGINAGSFPPKPANACANWCGVSRFCAATGGSQAEGVDPLLSTDLTITQIGAGE
jgi:RecB family exonuclease